MERLRTTIQRGHLLLDLDAHSVREIFEQAARLAADQGLVPVSLVPDVVAELWRREERISTAIGHAVAVPHAYLPGLPEPVVLFLRLKHPLNMGAPDGIPTRFLFVLLGPPDHAAEHLDTLTSIARLMSDEEFRYDAGEAADGLELLAALERFLERTQTVQPLAPALPPELAYTGRPGGGVRADMRRRLPHYASDFRDGLNAKALSSTLFLFFACLAPAVTFGGLMFHATGGQLGAAEMLASSALAGCVFALASGQPLVIVGGTGPLLVFTGMLYLLCTRLAVPFLPTYVWVGWWTALFTLILAATDASCLIRFFTRFTDEIFAALISTIFTVAAVSQIYGYIAGASNAQVSHDVAFLSLLTALGTFTVAMLLSRFRKSHYLRGTLRELLADFGPTLAVVLLVLFSRLFPQVALPALAVPDRFETTSGRAWLVDPFAAPTWVWGAAAAPALLLTVLVFMNQNITARLINSPQNRLKKGGGYHLDLAVVGGIIAVLSLFGLPWVNAATVRSLNHLRSLATTEEVQEPGGGARDQIIHVCETRLTGLGIHLLIAGSLLLLPLLKTVPMPVLYGLFLYMGVVSMSGNQFFERLSLWLTDPALYPRTHYIRRVPAGAIHAFTLLQLCCLLMLWAVQLSRIGILFPLFVALLVPVRLLAGRWFAPDHLAALDTEEEPAEEESTWM